MEFQSLYEELGGEGNKDADDALWMRCKYDKETFSLVFFPHYCEQEFNEYHRDLFEDYRPGVRGIREADCAPRGSAKSVLTTLIDVIHDVCYKFEKFVLVLSSTKEQSIQKLSDIRSEVLTNKRLVDFYKLGFTRSNPGTSKFEIVCGKHKAFVQAFSRGSELRGVRYGPHRPTKIICDDIEDSEEVENEEIRVKDRAWFTDVVSKVGSPRHTNIKVVGTLLHRDSLLKNIMKNPAYTSRFYQSIKSWSQREDLWIKWRDIYINIDNDDRKIDSLKYFEQNKKAMLDGTDVMWPEREDYYYLMEEMIEIGKRSFMKEKQNEPSSTGDKLITEMHWYREVPEGLQVERNGKIIPWDSLKYSCIGAMDPATGSIKAGSRKKKTDFTCIGTGFMGPKGRLFMHHDWTKRKPPTKYIGEVFELHERFGYNKFGVETNLYRELLLPNLIAERKRREKERKKLIKIPFYDIENTQKKEKRIEMLEPKITHGWILFNRALSQEFKSQIEEYPADHDDCPDMLEMLWRLAHNAFKPTPLSLNPVGMR